MTFPHRIDPSSGMRTGRAGHGKEALQAGGDVGLASPYGHPFSKGIIATDLKGSAMMRFLIVTVLALGLTAPTAESLAHHGWSWTTGGNIELTGVIKAVRLGNPHGILTIDVEGEEWRAEVGQPWRNERAGLKDGDLAEGVEIRLIGEPAEDVSEKRVKVERLYLGKREYILYPERD